jgi:hypothetical protein
MININFIFVSVIYLLGFSSSILSNNFSRSSLEKELKISSLASLLE